MFGRAGFELLKATRAAMAACQTCLSCTASAEDPDLGKTASRFRAVY